MTVGYDEALAYEDFDFWVRASREWQFQYLDAVTTRKRKHPASMSARAYRRHDPFVLSTLAVCRKALALCRTPAERAALATPAWLRYLDPAWRPERYATAPDFQAAILRG